MSEPPVQRRVIHHGRKFDVAIQNVTLRDGSVSEREVILHPGAVALLALLDAENLCLVRNRRHAIGETLLEVPAGTLDRGQTPRQTAERELREETGYTAGRIEALGAWWVSPGILNERMHLFACEDLTPGTMALEPDEMLEPVIVTWAEALSMVYDGRINDAKSMLALLIGDRWRKERAKF